MQLVYEIIFLNTILGNHLLSENMQWNYASFNVTLNYPMHEIMELWHILWRSTTESKNIVKLLAISQTIHSVCCEDDYFPKGQFKLFNSLFHSVYLVFPKSLFFVADLFAVRYLWVVCKKDKCRVLAQRAVDILFAWLVFVRTYCVPIATLNQNKRTRLHYLAKPK